MTAGARAVPGRERAVSWTAVALLTTVALGLRLFHMNAQSLWFDEIGSATIATRPLADVIGAVGSGTIEPTAWLSTAYNVLLRLVLLVPHSSPDWPLRLSSVVLGTLTVPALAWTVGAMAGPRAAIAAAGLLAISPFHVWYSQEVRPYVLLLLLVVLTLGALLRALARDDARWWAAVALGSGLALYTHPIGLGVPAICGVVLLTRLRTPRVLAHGALALAAAGAAFVPVVLLVRAHGGNAAADVRPTGILDVAYAVYAYAVGFSLGPSTHELHDATPGLLAAHVPLIALIAVVFGGLGLLGLAALRRLPAPGRWVVLAWLVLPLGVTVGIALLTANPFNVRYAIVSFPAFVVVLSLGLVDLQGARAAAATLGVLVLSLLSLQNLYFDPRYSKEATRDLAQLLRSEAHPDDLVLVNAAYMANAVRYYYPGPASIVGYPADEGRRDPPLDVAATADDLSRLVAGHRNVWLVLSRTFHGDDSGIIERALESRSTRESERRFPGIAVYRFAVRG